MYPFSYHDVDVLRSSALASNFGSAAGAASSFGNANASPFGAAAAAASISFPRGVKFDAEFESISASNSAIEGAVDLIFGIAGVDSANHRQEHNSKRTNQDW